MNGNLTNVRTLLAVEVGVSEPFEALFILKKVSTKTARTGAEFLMVELSDATGGFGTTCFNDSPAYSLLKDSKEGDIVRIEGLTGHYQGRFSPKILEAQVMDEAEVISAGLLGDLVMKAEEDVDALWEELSGYVQSIEHEGLRKTVEQVLEEMGEEFKTCPAAVSMHHAYCHGLLEHTVHVTRAGRALLPHYKEVDADLATAGMILHDMGKVIEYTGYRSVQKTRTGKLQGHVVLGYRIARKAAIQNGVGEDLLERLEHIILSHQGELEWGAAVMAATPEAVFVSMVDNLDARMGMVQQSLRQTPVEDEFSQYLPGLKGSVLVTPLERS